MYFLWKIWPISIKRCKLVGIRAWYEDQSGERIKESSLNGCLGVFVSLIIHIIFTEISFLFFTKITIVTVLDLFGKIIYCYVEWNLDITNIYMYIPKSLV